MDGRVGKQSRRVRGEFILAFSETASRFYMVVGYRLEARGDDATIG
jgi:hypothetical protein